MNCIKNMHLCLWWVHLLALCSIISLFSWCNSCLLFGSYSSLYSGFCICEGNMGWHGWPGVSGIKIQYSESRPLNRKWNIVVVSFIANLLVIPLVQFFWVKSWKKAIPMRMECLYLGAWMDMYRSRRGYVYTHMTLFN